MSDLFKQALAKFKPTGDKFLVVPKLADIQALVDQQVLQWQDANDPYCGNANDDELTEGERMFYVIHHPEDSWESAIAIGASSGRFMIS